MPSVSNIYELAAFLIVAGLQIYTRAGVNRVARNQELQNARHDASRAELLRMSEHMFAHAGENGGTLIDAIKAAFRVAYYQGQADTGTDRKFPEERATEAAKTLIELSKRVKGGTS
jgi:hypothetical protein